MADAIWAHPETISLAGNVTCDLSVFKSLIKSKDWLRAADQVAGVLLSDVNPGSDALDEWIDHKRTQIDSSIVTVARHLCDDLEFEASLRLAQLALDRNPWNVDAVQIVVQSLVRMDRREEAEAVAAKATSDWNSEFRESITFAIPDREDSSFDVSSSNVFVGREAELHVLADAWARAKDGVSCVFFVVGEAGIGKTATARRFQRLVALRGGRTAWASGYVLERNVPFGVIEQWLKELSPKVRDRGGGDHFSGVFESVLPGLPPELEPLEVGRQRIHAALALHVAQAAEQTPLCLILDDAQWADAASLAFLHYLMRHYTSLPFLLVAAARGDASLPLIRELEGSDNVLLKPLSLAETEELIELSKDQLSDLIYTPQQIHERAGGNPLLLKSLLADSSFLRDEAEEFPSSVVDFLLPRMNDLTTTAKIALGALGILSEPPRETLSQILGVDIGRCEDALHELAAAQFIDDISGQLRVRHGLSAELALTLLPPAVERQLRGRAARVLQKEGCSSAAILAAQFDVSGQRDRAFETAVTAASAAAELFAHKEAEFFYKLALSNSQVEGNTAQVKLNLANLFLATGRKHEARQILQTLNLRHMESAKALEARVLRMIVDLSGAADPGAVTRGLAILDTIRNKEAADLAARLALAIASAVHAQGDPDCTLEYCATRTKQLVECVVDPRLRVGIAVRLGALVAVSESYERGILQIDSAATEAARWPDTMAVCLAARGSACVAAGRLAEAEKDFLSAIELMERTGTFDSISMLANNLGVCYQEQGKFAEASRQYDIALKMRDQSDAPGWVQVTYDNLGILLFEKGEYEAAIDASDEGLTAARARKTSIRSFISQQSIKGLSCLQLGRRIEAHECRREIELARMRTEFLSNDISYVEIFMARMAEIDGAIEGAINRLRECISLYEARDFLCARRMEVELLRLSVDCDPATVVERAKSLRTELAVSGATNMVGHIDSIITRAQLY